MSAPYGSDIAPVAALLADRTRAAMLTALLDRRESGRRRRSGWRGRVTTILPGGPGSRSSTPWSVRGSSRPAATATTPALSAYEVTVKGAERLAGVGVDVAAVRASRRRFAGHCLDWTERRPHLNGALGAAVTSRLLDLGWLERGTSRRSLVLTEKGHAGLADVFGCFVD